ncbi:regulator of RNase E activity RraA [Pseudomonas hunanensis]|uniref:Regulator of RNase E activity RraA n=1 Tax=Pseudomonas hunanensis TaxID=1247546 RepID=A0ACC6JZW9_9PSED|nr:regulator of RNase E activity RraA [Pseudomonas hunanensis]
MGIAVACGNVVCYPGDAIIGDRDGIIVIARSAIPTLAEQVKQQEPNCTVFHSGPDPELEMLGTAACL